MTWTLHEPRPGDKDIIVSGPVGFLIDYDDVDHTSVLILARALVDTLNEGWNGKPPLLEALDTARANVRELIEEDCYDDEQVFAVMIGAQNIPFTAGDDPRLYDLKAAVEMALACQEQGGDAAVQHVASGTVVWV